MPPKVTVQAVQLTAIGLPVQQLAVVLCVTNPNPDALDFRQVSAKLDVAQAELLSGASDVAVHLAPMSSTPVPFSVTATVENLGPQLLAVIRSGEIAYRLHGTAQLAGFGGFAVPFSRSGRLDAVAMGRLMADRSGDTEAARDACATPPDHS